MSFYLKQAKFSMISDGVPQEDFNKVDEVAKELVEYICSSNNIVSTLLLGYVQSGKTNGMIMALAKLIDSNFECFVVLTGNDNDLYEQTYERIKSVNLGINLIKKNEISSYKFSHDGIVVFIVQKYGTYLEALGTVIRSCNKRFIVIDDEADQASLNTKINDPKSDPSTINNLIVNVLKEKKCKGYIQVTATPYALMLQEKDNLFRPQKTFILEPGESYVGGEELFLQNYSYKYHKIYKLENMSYCENDVVPDAMFDAVCNFLIAATLKRICGFSKGMSILIHMDYQKIVHETNSQTIYGILEIIESAIKKFIKTGVKTTYIDKLEKEYFNILTTAQEKCEFEEILEYLQHAIKNTDIQVINSDNNKKISYNSTYTILIGGNKLSRGITIKNLITTYYCRDVISPNMDTVNQHARMYGYRKDIKDVMRIFTTSEIINDFKNITNADLQLRKYLSENPLSTVIPITHNDRLNASRKNVIPNNALLKFTNGMTIFPHYPINDSSVINDTKKIDRLLKQYDEQREGYVVSIDLAYSILNTIRYNINNNETWNSDAVISVLKYKEKSLDGKIKIILRRNSQISYNKTRGIGAILSEIDNQILDIKFPILFLYRLDGKKEKGWKGNSFWVPVFRMPKNTKECITIQCY